MRLFQTTENKRLNQKQKADLEILASELSYLNLNLSAGYKKELGSKFLSLSSHQRQFFLNQVIKLQRPVGNSNTTLTQHEITHFKNTLNTLIIEAKSAQKPPSFLASLASCVVNKFHEVVPKVTDFPNFTKKTAQAAYTNLNSAFKEITEDRVFNQEIAGALKEFNQSPINTIATCTTSIIEAFGDSLLTLLTMGKGRALTRNQLYL